MEDHNMHAANEARIYLNDHHLDAIEEVHDSNDVFHLNVHHLDAIEVHDANEDGIYLTDQ